MSVCLFPILMVVWPRAFQYCAGFSGRLGLDAKSVTPEELSLISIFWGFCHQHPFSPTTPVSHSQPHLPRRLSKTHSWVLPPIQLLLCPRSQGLWILVCSFQVWNLLFPQVLLEILHSSPAGLQTQCFGDSSSRCQALRLGILIWGSGLSLLWENLCHIIILKFVGYPPGGYVTWVCHKSASPVVSLWLLLCLWM